MRLYLGTALAGHATTGDCLTAFVTGFVVSLVIFY